MTNRVRCNSPIIISEPSYEFNPFAEVRTEHIIVFLRRASDGK